MGFCTSLRLSTNRRSGCNASPSAYHPRPYARPPGRRLPLADRATAVSAKGHGDGACKGRFEMTGYRAFGGAGVVAAPPISGAIVRGGGSGRTRIRSPALPVFPPDEGIRLGASAGFHSLGVPLDLLAGAERE